MIVLALSLILALLVPSFAEAASVAHAFAEVASDQTSTSSTFGACTGASLADTNFTAGKKYLLFSKSQMSYTFGDGTEARVVHGSTEFDGSKAWIDASSTGWRITFPFMRVWTAVSSEGITLQFRSRAGGANTAYCNFASLFAMNLSDDLVENTDWFYNELSTDNGATTSWQDGASITVPAGTWFVAGHILTDAAAQITNYPMVRLTDGTNTVPATQVDVGVSTRDEKASGLERVYTVASSTTFKVQYAVSASTTANHLHSAIFALNMAKFAGATSAYTEGSAALSATDFATEIQTLSVTPTVQGDVWIGSYWTFDRNSGNLGNQRLQVDNSDVPAGQTTAVYDYRGGIDSTDREPMGMSTMVSSMTAAAHTVDMDASVDSTSGGPAALERTIWAIPLELAATGGASTRSLMLLGVGQ